jgi:hypothetical protein
VRAVFRIAPVIVIVIVAYATCPGYCQQTPAVDAIMAKVAENQERAEKARTAYLYKQRIVVTSRRTNGKLMCEEKTDYQILPSETGLQKERTRFEGKLWHKHSYVTYVSENDEKSGTKITPTDVSIEIPDDSIDVGLVRGFRDDLANDKTKDGLGKDLFPLTAEEQKRYEFQLVGQEQRQGRQVYRVRFRPKDRQDMTQLRHRVPATGIILPQPDARGLARKHRLSAGFGGKHHPLSSAANQPLKHTGDTSGLNSRFPTPKLNRHVIV